jgi:hypothetical protein
MTVFLRSLDLSTGEGEGLIYVEILSGGEVRGR